jgi:ribosomal protein S27AE
VENLTLDAYQIRERLELFYLRRENYYEGYALWVGVFGVPSIFYKIDNMVRHARELICPHCGEKGILAEKDTVSKRRYRYRKLYVYHETRPLPAITSLRTQKWCYLNEADLNNSLIQKRIQDWVRALNIEKHFYRCLILP